MVALDRNVVGDVVDDDHRVGDDDHHGDQHDQGQNGETVNHGRQGGW
jgi:hypothetical protein